jgi:diaminopimelate epimerase
VKLRFFKYQATGNDFVILDNRETGRQFSAAEIQTICDRKFGVGADGLMLIETDPKLDFKLDYYNSDGSQSLCGNGCRAAVAFASRLGLVHNDASFNAYDGVHQAQVLPNDIVRLKMNDVSEVQALGKDFYVHTGSPHYIKVVDHVDSYPVFEEGRTIRYSDAFKPGGTNVNFVELLDDNAIYVRTYERGVEDETLSCGTGVTAAGIAVSNLGYSSPVKIFTKGGNLSVEFKISQSGTFTDVYLIGPAKMVFTGELEL